MQASFIHSRRLLWHPAQFLANRSSFLDKCVDLVSLILKIHSLTRGVLKNNVVHSLLSKYGHHTLDAPRKQQMILQESCEGRLNRSCTIWAGPWGRDRSSSEKGGEEFWGEDLVQKRQGELKVLNEFWGKHRVKCARTDGVCRAMPEMVDLLYFLLQTYFKQTGIQLGIHEN